MQTSGLIRSRTVFLAALLAIILAFLVVSFVSKDSKDKANAVHYWVTVYDGKKHSEVRGAMAKFGPEAVPYLIREVRRKEPAWVKLLSSLRPHLPGPIRRRFPAAGEFTRTRRNALWALADFGHEAGAAIPAVYETLEDPDAELRKRAGEVLPAFGPAARAAVPKLVELLNSPAKPGPPRWLLMHVLGEIGPPASESLPTLIGLLRSKGETDRSFIPPVLAKIDRTGESVAQPMIEGLKDPDPAVRRRCASALGDLGLRAQKAVPALTNALSDGDQLVRQSAIYGLLQCGVTNADMYVPILLAGFDDKHGLNPPLPNQYQAMAAGLLGRIGPSAKNAVSSLVEALKSDDVNLRFYAAAALCRIDSQPSVVVPVLASFLCDERQSFSSRAAKLLGEMGDLANDAVPRLNEQMKDYREQIRSRRISHVMEDDKYPSFYAAEALWRITGNPASSVPVFTEFLKVKQSAFRVCAAKTIGQIGPEARSAIPALRAALHDKDEAVRSASQDALDRILQQ